MDQKTYETGLRIRSEVLGKEYVENSMKNADDFNRPFQEFVSEYCWGAGWGREGLSKKEIIRCLKRHIAREVYKTLTGKNTPAPPTPTPLELVA